MTWETLGEFGDGQIPDERDWIVACYEFAIAHLHRTCGEPPEGYKIGLQWHEHEYGSYPTLGISWDGFDDSPWEYMEKCEIALQILQESINWGAIQPDSIQDEFPEENDWEDEDEDGDN